MLVPVPNDCKKQYSIEALPELDRSYFEGSWLYDIYPEIGRIVLFPGFFTDRAEDALHAARQIASHYDEKTVYAKPDDKVFPRGGMYRYDVCPGSPIVEMHAMALQTLGHYKANFDPYQTGSFFKPEYVSSRAIRSVVELDVQSVALLEWYSQDARIITTIPLKQDEKSARHSVA